MSIYAEVAFSRKVGEKATLTYKTDLKIKVGDLVQVPLRNQKTYGIVFRTTDKKPAYSVREIQEICEPCMLEKWQIDLISWISEYYICPLFKVVKLFIPDKIFRNKKLRERKSEKGKISAKKEKELNKEQAQLLEEMLKNPEKLFLLHGITGSGKTEIYSRLAKEYVKKNQQVLILVPEISLTPQMVEYFEKSTGEKASVIHSRLSEGERIRAWKDIREKTAKIIIGSRSAIFSPFQNLGLIVVDEEHEPSYKQDQAPRYETRNVALKMAELLPDIKIVFGSATPSCETFSNKKITHLELKERFNKTPLPKVEITDMREEFKKGNFSIFSESLYKKIEQKLKKNEQIILFLNRRGNASSVICRECGYKETCPNCDVSMTYHKQKDPVLICHHCGKISKPRISCPKCKSHCIKYIGIGTQRVEEEVLKAFPGVRVLRADKDTTSKKHDFEQIYNKFRDHKADILIGTQMIGKGLHLPKVSLVGVILADIGLGIPDFRSQERTFQILTQVAGRSGRAGKQGEVVIQTYEPENMAIQTAKNHDYHKFYEQEIKNRKALNYPPFKKLVKLTYSDRSEKKCIDEMQKLEKFLKDRFEVLSYPALITRINGKYRYHILIKGENPRPENIPNEWKIDVDPMSIN